jgi:hypothetical protein
MLLLLKFDLDSSWFLVRVLDGVAVGRVVTPAISSLLSCVLYICKFYAI